MPTTGSKSTFPPSPRPAIPAQHDRKAASMDHDELQQRFAALTTAHLADACIRAGLPVRCAPAQLRALSPGSRLAGRVAPTRHAGSVDVFLEAFEDAAPGDILVADNAGRLDESCIGDLVALEAQAAGLSGIVIWGLHRDTADILAIGLPVFSLGAIPTGPLSLASRATERHQAGLIRAGTSLREQVRFGAYLAQRQHTPGLTFRDHLKAVGGA